MAPFFALLRDDQGSAIVEYSLTMAFFGFGAMITIFAYQLQTSNALINTRARMTCESISLRSTVTATVDAAGNVTCS